MHGTINAIFTWICLTTLLLDSNDVLLPSLEGLNIDNGLWQRVSDTGVWLLSAHLDMRMKDQPLIRLIGAKDRLSFFTAQAARYTFKTLPFRWSDLPQDGELTCHLWYQSSPSEVSSIASVPAREFRYIRFSPGMRGRKGEVKVGWSSLLLASIIYILYGTVLWIMSALELAGSLLWHHLHLFPAKDTLARWQQRHLPDHLISVR